MEVVERDLRLPGCQGLLAPHAPAVLEHLAVRGKRVEQQISDKRQDDRDADESAERGGIAQIQLLPGAPLVRSEP